MARSASWLRSRSWRSSAKTVGRFSCSSNSRCGSSATPCRRAPPVSAPKPSCCNLATMSRISCYQGGQAARQGPAGGGMGCTMGSICG
jgi:hypothetical protein